MLIDSSHLSDSKKLIREKIVPWEGLARAGVISADQADLIKVLETQNAESKRQTVLNSLEMYAKTILNLLSKLEINSRDDVLKSVLVLINDLLLDREAAPFTDALSALSSIDPSLPFSPFVKHLANNDQLVKTLSFHNTTILLDKAAKSGQHVNKEIVIKLFDLVSSKTYIGNKQDANMQSIGVQLLQELTTNKSYRLIYQEHNLVSNFAALADLVNVLAKLPNSANLQLLYNTLMSVWLLSFDATINKAILHSNPMLIGDLLTISKEGAKVKVVRVAVSSIKNFIMVTTSNQEQFNTIKLLLFNDGLNTLKLIQTRKFASKSSDEELADDLDYLTSTLSDVVSGKLTSLDEYLVELDNPHLLSWSSPTHKSEEFWKENASKFKENSFSLVKKIMAILSSDDNSLSGTSKVILLSDLQHLIRVLGSDLTNFINNEKSGHYKLLIMSFLENSNGNNELKYEGLRTIQYLVGQS